MSKKYVIVIFFSLFIALFISTPKILLFYDAPEYTDIVANNTFWKSVSMGHTPIHPVFTGILWIIANILQMLFPISREYAGNLTAFIFSLISLILFYKLSDYFLKKMVLKILSCFIFFFFASVWIIHTNLFVESVTLPFFLFSGVTFFKFLHKRQVKNGVMYSLSLMLMMGTHIESLFWIPSLIGLWFLIKKESWSTQLKGALTYTFLGIALTLLLYSMVFVFSGKELILSLKDIFFAHRGGAYDATSVAGILRMGRNVYLNVAKGYSTILFFLLGYLAFLSRKSVAGLVGWGLIFLAVFIEGAIWTGDFMPRRLVFLTVISALLITRQYGLRAIYFLLYLSVITLFNAFLYSRPAEEMPIIGIKEVIRKIPGREVYLQTHYLYPFVKDYPGEILFIESTAIPDLKERIVNGKRIFIDSQTVKAPYYLYVGNNYHITSLGKSGNSPARDIFMNFRVCFYDQIDSAGLVVYEVKEKGVECISDYVFENNTSGSSVLFYSPNIKDVVKRERIDHGDIAIWVWYLLSNKKDPIDWTYSDVNGNYIDVYSSTESIIVN